MKKIYFTFLVPIFLYSQNLEELVNLTIENRLVESSKQNLDALKDEYKSVQRGYLPKLDAGASYSINEHEYPNNPKKEQMLMVVWTTYYMMVGKNMIFMMDMKQI